MANGSKYRQWMKNHYKEFIDGNGDLCMTTLAETCADHFGLKTELGDSEEETIMFEIATEFSQDKL